MNLQNLTIVVVTYNSMNELPDFLDNLQKVLGKSYFSVLVCDNNSNDGVDTFLKKKAGNIELLKSHANEGYGAALNRGIRHSSTPYIALMNPDVRVEPHGFDRLIDFLDRHPEAAGVSGIVKHLEYFPSNFGQEILPKEQSIQVHFRYESLLTRIIFYTALRTKFPKFKRFLVPWSVVKPQDSVSVSRLNGSFGVFRKSALIEVGMFDPRFFLYFEEDDLALRLRQNGHKLYVTDHTIIVHKSGTGSANSGNALTQKILLNSQYMFFRKHYGLLYAWFSFFSIWGVFTLLLMHNTLFKRPGKRLTRDLWQWHLDSLLSGGRVPKGTIPNKGKKGVNYNWVDRI